MMKGLLLLFTLLLGGEPKELPCTDSSTACVAALQQTAIGNDREIRILEQAIELQRRKLWTSWLNADGIHPVAIVLRVARNIAGGGDHAAGKLEIVRLKARRAELESNLRRAIARKVLDLESAIGESEAARSRLETLIQRMKIFIVSYRLGDGSTTTMLQFWQSEEEMKHELSRAKAGIAERLAELRELVGSAGINQ